MRIDFKRLEKMVSFLANNANIPTNDVLIISDGDDICLRAANDNMEHFLQITGEQVIYHTKMYVEI